MQELAHIPVLADEVIAYLDPRPGGLYWDGTVGVGGHTRLLAERSAPDGRVVGSDRDGDAIATTRHALASFGDRVALVHGSFGNIASIVESVMPMLCTDPAPEIRFDGMLLDIGVSSPQLDRPERGFSFLHDGPIDMRMDRSTGDTALQLLRRLTRDELTRVLRDYGEEKLAGRIADRIKDALARDCLHSTTELAALVSDAIPARQKRQMKIHPATRTFQALRIAVNRELDELATFLARFPDFLAPGGRCVIISFHSLEDRLVKQRFRELAQTSSLPPELARQAGERTEPICIPLTRKPVVASDDEIARNPRSRSARLRACQKVAA